ncbi:NAD(P)H-binding protein [Streptomyces sp. NPDC000594]|uniref:NAD(P)H-binding protein n=1 Tax=Streptomyces sp. NPDC000594 TaxID=3154261 RepID=UPI00332256ED
MTTNEAPSSTSSPSSAAAPVLVLGGTGKTGRRVAAQLAARGVTPRIASRNPGPEGIRFDWSDPDTWGPALAGVRAVYVVDSQGPDAAEEVRAFGRAAAGAGVERLVLLSARVWVELPDPDGTLLAVERAVQDSGLDWTMLRPSWFSQNFHEAEWMAVPLLTDGDLRIPTGEGREPFVDLEDLAEVAALALTEDGHAGRAYDLTGPVALTMREVAEAISLASGRTLTYTPVTADEYRAEQAARAVPEHLTELLIGIFGHIAVDGSATIGDGVREALGRDARPFSAYTDRTDFSAPSLG